LRLKNFVILITHNVLIKTKPFALELTRVIRVILYLFFDIIYNIRKYLLLIN
jgi:hypothetical protein